MDGTLLNTLNDLYCTMQSVLKIGDYPGITMEEVRLLIGNGAREFLRLSLPEGERSEENVDKFLNIYYTEYEKFSKYSQPYDGIDNVLRTLNDRNIPIAVLSNKPHGATVDVVAHFFGDISFVSVLGQTEHFAPKPDVSSALYSAEKLGLKPQEIAFIGDGDADAEVAVQGGFYPATVLWGYRTKEELLPHGAVNFYKKPSDLLKLFI